MAERRFLVSRGLTSWFCLFLFFLLACGTEVNSGDELELSETSIEGEWEVVYALRAGSPTSTLDGAVFNFRDGMFSSNILEEGMVGNYEIEGETIITGLRNPEQFEVVNFDAQRLVLRTRISGFDFEFELERTEDNEEHFLQ